MKIILVSIAVFISVLCLPISNGQGYGIVQQPVPFPPAIDPVPLTDIEWNQQGAPDPSEPWVDEPQDPLTDDVAFPGFPSNPPNDQQDPPLVNQPPISDFPPRDQRPPIAQFPADPQDQLWASPGKPGRVRPAKRPTKQHKKPKRPRKPKSNKCQRLAKRGSCRFYKCFEKIEPSCLNQGDFFVQDLQTFCENAQFVLREKQFTKQGRKYINKVRKCQTKQLLTQVNSQSCDAINNLATLALLGSETGTVSSQDCYWQNQEFCNIICSSQDNKALVQVLFNNNDGEDYDEEQVALGQHLQYLSGFCPDVAQKIFTDSFVNECPAGTLDRANDPPVNPPLQPQTTSQMMMVAGAGGD